MTGIAYRLATGPITKTDDLRRSYEDLLKKTDYRDAVETGTSQEAKVTKRLDSATKAFAKIK
jgi:hypothetical protein